VVEGFLKGLELRAGYIVKRDPRVRRTGQCPVCATEYEYTTEKRVDTRLVPALFAIRPCVASWRSSRGAPSTHDQPPPSRTRLPGGIRAAASPAGR
jgi:hypothetical protein